jgi:hypothetical protein
MSDQIPPAPDFAALVSWLYERAHAAREAIRQCQADLGDQGPPMENAIDDDGRDVHIPCVTCVTAAINARAFTEAAEALATTPQHAPVAPPDLAALVARITAALRTVRERDCGAHYCRYCSAGSKNQWQHESYCLYVESQKQSEEARALILEMPGLLAALTAAHAAQAQAEQQRDSLAFELEIERANAVRNCTYFVQQRDEAIVRADQLRATFALSQSEGERAATATPWPARSAPRHGGTMSHPCSCQGTGTCLWCLIFKTVRDDFGTEGEAFLLSVVSSAQPSSKPPVSTTEGQP